MNALVATALLHGAALSAGMIALVLASLVQDPRIWTSSLPPDARALAGPPPPATVRRRRGWSVVMLALLLGVFGHLAHAVDTGGLAGAADVAVASYLCFLVWNVVDVGVVDLALVKLRPRFAVIPGTEAAPGLRSMRWHLRGFFIGLVIGVPLALVVGALSLMVS